MRVRDAAMLGALALFAVVLSGCQDLGIHDTASLLAPRFQRSEIVGLVAGAGTTFAALPDLIAMLRRRSSKGMSPRMAAIMGVFHRYEIARKYRIHLGLDLAFAPQNTAVYVQVGSAWARP